jgi:streptomycin 6-kinase
MSQRGYYSTFELPRDLVDAEALRNLLGELWKYRYDDLYEDEADGRPLEDDLMAACQRIVSFLATQELEKGHQRLLYLGWTLALSTLPTIEAWLPEDKRPQMVLDEVRAVLEGGRRGSQDWKTLLPPAITGSQALDEALNVFSNLIRALDPTEAPQALLNILDDCLQGYAVFPGSDGRRDLFNWLLLEAVPAAWSLHLPDAIYTFRWSWPPLQK